MAEALLLARGEGRFEPASAGSRPAARVNPYAIDALARAGIDWSGRRPKGIDAIAGETWDFVITVCDRAKEACPILPGRPVMAHWGMEDPAEVEGSDADKSRAFQHARQLLARRIDLMLALPLGKLERLKLEAELRAIGSATA